MRAQFGSISSATMLPEDLIPRFEHTLRYLRGSIPRGLYNDIRALKAYDSEEALRILDSLFDLLDECAPPYGYFGAHPSDGADYGFWLCEDWQQMARDDGVLEVEDTSEVPSDYTGEVLHVNDHGNATLYACARGRLREIWAVV